MKNIIPVFAAACAAMALTGCSIFQKAETVTGASGTKYPATMPAPQPASSEKPVSKPDATPAAKPDTVAAPAQPAKTVAASSRDLGGEWLIVQVGSKSVDRDEDMPYIIFGDDGRFYGYDGCNTLNGQYSLSADDRFTFSNMMNTMRYCPDEDIQHGIKVAMDEGNPVRAKFYTLGSESFIDLLSGSGKTSVKLRRADIDFLNGHWEVTMINGTSVEPQAVPDLFFDIAERKIHGNTGCNYFNGDIYLDHRRPNAIDFSKMGLTRMACPYTTQETAMMVALEETASAISGGRDTAMLLSADGRELISLRRLPDEPQQ